MVILKALNQRVWLKSRCLRRRNNDLVFPTPNGFIFIFLFGDFFILLRPFGGFCNYNEQSRPFGTSFMLNYIVDIFFCNHMCDFNPLHLTECVFHHSPFVVI